MVCPGIYINNSAGKKGFPEEIQLFDEYRYIVNISHKEYSSLYPVFRRKRYTHLQYPYKS